MWLPQGGALKIENLQFTQYSIIMQNGLHYTTNRPLAKVAYLTIETDYR